MDAKHVVHEIRAELVGVVSAVLVQPGEVVEQGTQLAVMDSMKMEIPILTEWPGTIVSVHISKEDVVHVGDILMVLHSPRLPSGNW